MHVHLCYIYFFLLILVIKKRETSTGDEPTFSYFAFLNIFQVNHKSFIKYLYFQPGFKYGYKKIYFYHLLNLLFKQRYLILAIILQELLHHFYILTNSRLFKMYLKLHRHFYFYTVILIYYLAMVLLILC